MKKFAWLKRLFLVILVGLYVCFCLVIITLSVRHSNINPGVELVRLMYDFESPRELVVQQESVKAMLTDGEWKRLQLNNTMRVTSAYQKFQYSRSRVRIVTCQPGYVMYRIVNDNISEDDLWILQYDIDKETGRLCDIREYKVLYQSLGGYTE